MQLVYAASMLVAFFVMVVVVFLIMNDSSSSTPRVHGGNPGGGLPPRTFELVPSTFSEAGKTHYYQVPSNARGTLMMLPGCSRAATGYWPHSAKAPECNAFPEDVSHTKQALLNGYAMFVPTPQNPNLCFTSSSGDFEKLGPIIKKFFTLTGLGGKPLYVAGSSAGGGVAVRFPEYAHRQNLGIRFSGLLLECATNQSPLNGDRPSAPSFPPTVWVCMERDTESLREANGYAQVLQRNGVGCAVITSPKRRITPEYFSERMVNVTPAQSKQVVDGLRAIGMVDGDGWVTANPHDNASAWMSKLRRHVPAGREFTLGSVRKSPIYQAVAVAYAGHEHIADYTTAALKFFESGGKASMDDLVARHQVTKPALL